MNGAVGIPGSRERALLAIDTSLGTSVALGVGDRVFEAVSDDPMRHAEIVGPLLERVLDESGVDPSRIAGVVCGIGPGPFTGLRVGIAAARAFAVGRGVPLLPLHGHEAVAFEVLSRGAAAGVRVVQDARRRELFVTEYSGLDWAELPVRSVDPHLVARAEYAEAPHEVWPERIPGGALIRLAALRLAAGRPFESERPLYLREPDIKQPGAQKRVSA
ncbi:MULTISPECIES: tRNA (adenosine(37)-N6)-threonylcarbamoyltransferase complex dimerization subunit type 1 TsaB [Leucobacter]|uniref:tRNA (Adenosine(37)-N6)-threonylcarbamoyltransferase complex dimerization subunit type 1 TsaB n=1 Tax=Leucobacter iarius TaxID=333963 RepID=A0ABN2LCV1_9MICO|nr:tRNA (adenosine(37)-N6)-threonylcarbamoyltransferase complex dimerization subunit type 1 TsaB [Leucobacter sp. Ag1]